MIFCKVRKKRCFNEQFTNIFADIDDCINEPCGNGGTCIDDISGFICECVPGYEGVTCQYSKLTLKNIHTCEEIYNVGVIYPQ